MTALRTARLALILTCALGASAAGAAAATPPPAPVVQDDGKPIVIGRSYVLNSAILGASRTINVWLPAGYSDPKRRFRVLYLLDGGEAEDFHHISGVVQIVGAYGAAEEMIVVGISDADPRLHDLTSTPTHSAKDAKDFPKAGGADAYRRFLVEELKPWVAARYRTTGQSALMGESLAGLFAVETLLRAPQSFDDYIVASPSLWWDDEALSREAEADLRKGDFSGRRLWLGMADEGPPMLGAADRIRGAVTTVKPTGLTLTWDPRMSERHDTIWHPVALAALRSLYATPKKPGA